MNTQMKTYEEIMDSINASIISNPVMLDRQIQAITEQIRQLDEELGIRAQTTPQKRLEIDWFKNTIKYMEFDKEGNLVMMRSRIMKAKEFQNVQK